LSARFAILSTSAEIVAATIFSSSARDCRKPGMWKFFLSFHILILSAKLEQKFFFQSKTFFILAPAKLFLQRLLQATDFFPPFFYPRASSLG
jgi:hypothetical protein